MIAMSIFRTLIVTVVLCGVPSLSLAQTRTLLGYPSVSCGKWVSERKEKSSISAEVMKAWASGAVSGANGFSDGKDWLKDVDAEVIFVWLDNRCGKDPLLRFVDAVRSLVLELRAR